MGITTTHYDGIGATRYERADGSALIVRDGLWGQGIHRDHAGDSRSLRTAWTASPRPVMERVNGRSALGLFLERWIDRDPVLDYVHCDRCGLTAAECRESGIDNPVCCA